MQDIVFFILMPGANSPRTTGLSASGETAVRFVGTLQGLFPEAAILLGVEDASEPIVGDLVETIPTVAIEPAADMRAAEALRLPRTVDSVRATGRPYVVVLDLNETPPDCTQLFQALERVQQMDTEALCAVRETPDHPSQLKSYFNFHDAGVLHLVDDQWSMPEAAALLATKPFAFDWGCAHGAESRPGTMHSKRYAAGRIAYAETRAADHDWTGSGLLLRVDDATARIVFSHPDRSDITGIAFTPDLALRMTMRHAEDGAAVIRLEQDADAREDLLLRLCHRVTEAGNADMEMEAAFHHGEIRLQESLSGHGVNGYSMALLKVSNNQIFDIVENYKPSNNLWYTDNLTKKTINSVTGKAIAGRQDFPDVVALDPRLVAVKSRSMDRLPQLLRSGDVTGFSLDDASQAQPFDIGSVSTSWEVVPVTATGLEDAS